MSILMKDSNNILIGDIPNNWNIKRIKDIVKIKISDGPHSTPTLELEGIPFISAEAIKNNKLDFNKKRGFISEEAHREYSKKCKPQRNDIFIIKSGATTGNVAYVDTDIEFNIWSPLAVVRCNEYEAHYKFVYYQLLSDIFRKQVELSWSFGTQENIGMGVLGRLFITIPPFYEQKQIADFLDKATLQIDDAIKTKEKQLKTLEALKKSIIHKAVTKGLDDSVAMIDSKIEWIGYIPKHWKIDRIKDLSKRITGGGTPKSTVPEYWEDGDIIWVTPTDFQDVKNSKYINDSRRKITENGLMSSSAELLPRNTLIMSSRASIGIPKLTSIELSTNQGFISFIQSKKLSNDYLYYCIESYLGDYYLTIANGTTFKEISPTLAKQENIPFPPKGEQERIVEYLDTEVEKINTLKENVKKQIDKLKEYKKSLIYEYVTGKKQIKG